MSVSRDLALTSSYDLAVVGQDLAPLVADDDAIVSDVESTILFVLGEWFADLSQGVPWFEQALGKKKVSLAAIRASLSSAIAARLGITQVQSVNVTTNVAARSAQVVWTAFADDTLLGSTVVVSP